MIGLETSYLQIRSVLQELWSEWGSGTSDRRREEDETLRSKNVDSSGLSISFAGERCVVSEWATDLAVRTIGVPDIVSAPAGCTVLSLAQEQTYRKLSMYIVYTCPSWTQHGCERY
jgi:hypothetical protein